MKATLNIVTVSFDRREILKNNPEEIIEKLNRDRMRPRDNNFLLISWAASDFEKKISEHLTGVNLKSRFTHMRPLYDFLSIFYIPYVVRKHKFSPDVFIVSDFPLIFSGLFLKFFWGTKIIITVTNLPRDLLKTRSNSVMRDVYQRSAEFFGTFLIDKALVINRATKTYVSNLGVPEGNIRTFCPDVISRDLEFIKNSKRGLVRNRFAIPENKKILFSVGRLEKEKGFERLIRLFSEMDTKDWVLIIAGRGSLEGKLKELIKENNLEDAVVLVGYIERKDIWDFYRDADLFILLPHSEALGLVFWEAMYMKVPVLGSGAAGVLETIGGDGERGFIWEEKEGPLGLEHKIKKALRHKDRSIVEMTERASAYVHEKMNAEEGINDFV
ncbi:MAG: glycosyltransferase [Patescibacteria group bacterium]|nr:glycosyltransferase [Patescibacteria group bacterium]